MKAAVVLGKNDIRVVNVPDPVCGAGEVKVKVAYCGICGSDIPRVLKGTCHSFPQVLGHEFSGEIVEIGSGVSNVSMGDHVVGVPLVPCFSCGDCRKGNYSLCRHYSFVGSRQQGAMAEFVVLPAMNVLRIDPSVSLARAALTEPSTVALHGVMLPGFKPVPEDWVAVIGLGPIGLFALEWCRILGAKHIISVGRNKDRLAVARKHGADAVVSTLQNDCVESILAQTKNGGCAYVFDAAGTAETTTCALKIMANHGNLCLIGTPTSPVSFGVRDWELINRREMSVTGSWMSYSNPWPGLEWKKTVNGLKTGELVVDDAFVHAEHSLDDVRAAFDLFATPNVRVAGRILLRIA